MLCKFQREQNITSSPRFTMSKPKIHLFLPPAPETGISHCSQRSCSKSLLNENLLHAGFWSEAWFLISWAAVTASLQEMEFNEMPYLCLQWHSSGWRSSVSLRGDGRNFRGNTRKDKVSSFSSRILQYFWLLFLLLVVFLIHLYLPELGNTVWKMV